MIRMLWKNRKKIGKFLAILAMAAFLIYGVIEEVVPAVIEFIRYWGL